MSSPLLSNVWYRVAALKPRLRPHARLHRHRYRREVWYLLQDPASNRVHRFSAAARMVIAAMNGSRTVEEIWELANKRLGEEAPTQDDVIHLLGQLHGANLLQSDITPDANETFERGLREHKSQRQRNYMNPLSIRIPLWDPDAFLQRWSGTIQFVWGRWGALLWLLTMSLALILLPPNWQALTHNFSDQVLSASNLFLLGLVFPVIKALHELGHASATKAGGGEVHDMGLMFLVLMPVPYVEASASSVFVSKYQRALVGAAGILVELFLAAIAFFLWLLVEPGILRATLFNVMLIASVSTLAFNGNPLLRYDAYYIFADLIEMPNLAHRSQMYWQYLLKCLLGFDEQISPESQRSGRAWLVFYGVASTAMRIMVTIAIALFIANQFFVVGVLLALWAILGLMVLPVFKGLKFLFTSPQIRNQRSRALISASSILAGMMVFLLAVPMPYRSTAEGVIWFSDDAMVRANQHGFVREFLAKPGTVVAKGDPLIKLEDPKVTAEFHTRKASVAELEALYVATFVEDQAKAAVIRGKLEGERAILLRVQEQIEGLTARAGTAGTFVVPQAENMSGRFYGQGSLLGYVIENGQPLARVVVSQSEVDQVRLATDRVKLRYVHQPDKLSEGRIVRMTPAGIDHLPSVALASEGGGHITTDPRDTSGTKTLERMFQFDIELASSVDNHLIDDTFYGERVYVRFSHDMEPLALQWYRGIRLLFLSHFSI